MARIEPTRPSAAQVIQNRPPKVEPNGVKSSPVEPRMIAQNPSKGHRIDVMT